ncbi:MAG: dihydroorotate dehydrogenase [Ignavibacteriales bacterium CG07_land_8_20_14_0_80_59_12]|nr:MAG: dihydroorotate dehydrogenase [Ignavibacteriales bacterium CG07_land_8_20_14_0_80_59_12]
MVDQTFTLGGVRFQNRVFVASGTFGYGDEVLDLSEVGKLGGIVTKSITLKPRTGNRPRRIVETAGGMLNSIGLANIGVERFLERLPGLLELGTKIIVNIAGSTFGEYVEVLSRLEEGEGIAAYELNVSCPNVKEGGLEFGTDPHAVETITKSARERTRRPIIVKLTPNVTRIGETARAAEAGGADAVSAINTLVGMSVNRADRTSRLGTVTGGLSGPAIKPVALAKVRECTMAVKIPVIGIGGITTADDALEFIIVGAAAVQVGTASFAEPNAAACIAGGIASYCERNGIASVEALVGSLQIPAPPRLQT